MREQRFAFGRGEEHEWEMEEIIVVLKHFEWSVIHLKQSFLQCCRKYAN